MSKIAVDIDGVLAKTTHYFIEYLNITYNTAFTIEEVKSYSMIEIDEQVPFSIYKELLTFLKKNVLFIPFYKDSLNNLNNLSNTYDLYILTSRNNTLMEGTKKWITNHLGENLFREIISLDNTPYTCKSDVCLHYGFEVLIEDAPHFAENARNKGINVFLFSQPWNEHINQCSLLKRVKNWDEIGELL